MQSAFTKPIRRMDLVYKAVGMGTLGLVAYLMAEKKVMDGYQAAGGQRRGKPSLEPESNLHRFTWTRSWYSRYGKAAQAEASTEAEKPFENIILQPGLKKRIEQLFTTTTNTVSCEVPFRNILFHGPSGTGKTMVVREIAKKSGLDYVILIGGDIDSMGNEAAPKLHQLFDKKSKRGLLVVIDDADEFLYDRENKRMSHAQRSAVNALLYRTSGLSPDVALVLATSKPYTLDIAVTDRIDEFVEIGLPGEEERFKLLKLYLNKYLSGQVIRES